MSADAPTAPDAVTVGDEDAPGTADAGSPLTVTICRDPARFAALAPAWDALHRRCPAATPFQTHAWLHSWWLSYGRRRRLRLVLVHHGGELVAAAPLTLAHRPYPVLLPLGTPVTDFTDILLLPGERGAGLTPPYDPNAALDALAGGIRRAAPGAVLDLREVRPGAAAEGLYARWYGPKRRLPDSICLEFPGLPIDGLIARTPSSRGQRIRQSLRALDAAGLTAHDIPPERAARDAPAAIDALLRLHLLQWQGRGMTPEHRRPRFAEHLTRAVTAMAAAGDAVVTEYRREGELVAAGVTVLSPRLAGGYLYGAHPALRAAKVDVSALLMRHGARHAAEGGRETLSLLRGAEPHKFHWRPEHRVNQRLLLSGRAAAPALMLRHALALARVRAARSARLRALRDGVRRRVRLLRR